MNISKEPLNSSGILERLFHIKEKGTSVRTELLAGITTFLSMVYILAVNPSILGQAGMNTSGVFVATALAAFLGTIVMAFMANYPLVLAPGMGLNAYFAYSVVIGMGYSWQVALLAVFIEGVLFIVLSLSDFRGLMVNVIPNSLKTGIGVGIGIYLTYIGLQNASIIVNNDVTLTAFSGFASDSFHTSGVASILAFMGVVVIAVLAHKKVPGAIFWGIIGMWLLAIVAQITGVYQVDVENHFYSVIPSLNFGTQFQELQTGFREVFWAAFDSTAWTKAGSELTGWNLILSLNILTILFALLFVDFFDTMGTVIGVANKGNLFDQDGKIPRLRAVFFSDAVATSIGAALGTSTTTTYLESFTGISIGGRTGLTALVAAILFLVAIVMAPFFLALPSFITASALIYVGFLMISNVVNVDFDDASEALPSFIAMTSIPLTYSISEGISLSVIFWTLINCGSGQYKKVNWFMWGLTLIFIARYFYL